VLPECGFVVERSSILGGVKRMVKVCSSVGGRIFRIEHAPIYPLLRLRVIGVNRGSDSFWGPRLSSTKTLYPLFNGVKYCLAARDMPRGRLEKFTRLLIFVICSRLASGGGRSVARVAQAASAGN
jgi:hypothetical protein